MNVFITRGQKKVFLKVLIHLWTKPRWNVLKTICTYLRSSEKDIFEVFYQWHHQINFKLKQHFPTRTKTDERDVFRIRLERRAPPQAGQQMLGLPTEKATWEISPFPLLKSWKLTQRPRHSMRSIRRERNPRDYKDTARLTSTPLNNVVFLKETLRKACLWWLIAFFF